MFSNSELFSPAGQSLDLAKGTRVLNLELAQQKKFVVVKQNKGISVIDADSFKLITQAVYEKGEAGSMYGLAVDGNDSTVYFTGSKQNLYVGNINKSGVLTLTKKIVNHADHIVFMISGNDKAHALYEVIEGERNPDLYPSQVIIPIQGELHFFVDEAAASALKTRQS